MEDRRGVASGHRVPGKVVLPPLTRCSQCDAPLPVLLDDPYCRDGAPPRTAPVRSPGPRAEIATGPSTLWRYRHAFALPPAARPVSLGEGFVPLEPLELPGLPAGVLALRDDLEPTGSWKDRGAALLVTALAARGHADLVETGSLNASVSLAAYCAHSGVRFTAYLRRATAAADVELVRRAGGRVVLVDDAGALAEAARRAVRAGAVWGSYAAQPLFAAGAATAAFNITESLGHFPDVVIVPVGHGALLAGLYAGFCALLSEGYGPLPRLVGVRLAEADAVSPDGERRLPPPLREREVGAAVAETGGALVTADRFSVDRALRMLWRAGFRVEPAAALPVAWLLGLDGESRERMEGRATAVVLTGHGTREGGAGPVPFRAGSGPPAL